ncbi:hypothetical protein D1869_10415 [Sulfurisphaera ohwakuensis]|uniref:Uncharacterized protein n=1 Tax=Sulfurisphaera ohwakuensis TaxID=69656 RepID=A0A650CL55_SULOH|nr:hypothetical protein D1869_10415 [Sulfurisphaera ohwakuensis]
MPNNKYIIMKIVEDKDGERFLVIESKEDLEKFKEDVLRRIREKAKAYKPSMSPNLPNKYYTVF